MRSTTYAVFIFFGLILVNTLIRAGEPVPGAKIYVEFEPGDEPIFNGTTNEHGEFKFSIPDNRIISKTLKFEITVFPPDLNSINKTETVGYQKQVIIIDIPKQKSRVFKFVLTWEPDAKTQNRGSFAVSGKSDA